MARSADHQRGRLRAAPLDEHAVAPDPTAQFEAWFEEARRAEVDQPDAMVLATTDGDGKPAARVVLLRGVDARGLAFYTNLESAKGRDLAALPQAALVFHWKEIGRQVRVTGPVSRVPDEEAARYFESRPRGSQVGAWASPQSEPLAGRAELEQRVAETEARFANAEPPLPPYWGGFIVGIETLELWQARDSRLHDRVRYRRAADGSTVERLAP